MKQVFRMALAAIAVVALSSVSTTKAAFVEAVDLTNWISFTGYHGPGGGTNSGVQITNILPGYVITGIEYQDVNFQAVYVSWASEATLSVNLYSGGFNTLEDWFDHRPSTDNTYGNFGPFSGDFGQAPGVGFASATLPYISTGEIWVTVYDTFDDGLVPPTDQFPDSIFSSGRILIHYDVPEPSAAALGLVGLGLAAWRRRRA